MSDSAAAATPPVTPVQAPTRLAVIDADSSFVQVFSKGFTSEGRRNRTSPRTPL